MVAFIRPLIERLKDIKELAHVQIWNSQFDYIDEGQGYSFPFPCAFVEVTPNEDIGSLGSGFQGSDLTIKIHLGSDFYNGFGGDVIDDNFNIFALRETVSQALFGFKTSTSGAMFKINEEQDFNHSNVYHYVMTYKVHFIDDTTAKKDLYTTPPTGLNINNG